MSKMSAIEKYKVERWCYLHHLKPLAWIIRNWIYLIHNSYIPYTCEIGEGTELGYKGIGVVIHSNARIGRNCMIGTNVTIGGRENKCHNLLSEFDDMRGNVPVIGDGVYISTGAKVLGNVVIGNNAVIGANAVVISDVPCGATVGGASTYLKFKSLAECIKYGEGACSIVG